MTSQLEINEYVAEKIGSDNSDAIILYIETIGLETVLEDMRVVKKAKEKTEAS